MLGAAFVLAVLRTIGVDPVVLVVLVALAGGVAAGRPGAADACWAMLLLSYLAVANVAFVAMFLFASPTAELVAGGGSGDLGDVVGARARRRRSSCIVLDEFPAATIMRPDGTINSDRFPGFAELASVSTWFRNASSQHNLTHRAVPSILDGRLAADGTLPTYGDHPRNLFTLLGGDGPGAQLRVGDVAVPAGHLCRDDPAAADAGARGRLDRLRPPAPARARCATGCRRSTTRGAPTAPRTTAVAAATARTSATPTRAGSGLGADERSPLGQAGRAQRAHRGDHAEPALHFVHVAVPHRPWVLSPSGYRHVVRPGADP